ncbi:endonuclease VII domain-containing protein [Embleya sp. NBC_00888]|uniref:endonuclease domain-containing protein n=1 Tax=Embleya sp. NBC_00888 TaxID=2975960 RepID=UPI003866CA39|nr:endonuclease VII domain-containing protein [Embleya sp. NBC_00888]
MTDALFDLPAQTAKPPPYKTCEAFPEGSDYPPCPRPMKLNRLCDAHDQQRRAGKRLGPIRKRRRNLPEFCVFTLEGGELAEPCGKPTISDGYCNAHYQQRARRGKLVPLHTLRISQERVEVLRRQGMKWCPFCKTAKSFEAFPSGSSVDGCAPYCSPCHADYCTAKRFSFPSVNALCEFRESRDHRCDICKQQWQEGDPAFHIDHDGTCCGRNRSCGKCVRGYLCQMCNTCGLAWYEAVGRATATIPLFEDYLSRYATRRNGSLADAALD